MGAVIPQVVTEDRASEAQFIDGSLRFDSTKSHYLSRTPAGVGTSLTTGTISMWVKITGLTSENYLFSAGNDTSDYFIISINTSNQIRIFTGENGATNLNLTNTVAVFRDPSAWYHLLIQLDWDNAISSDRIKLYVNGIRVTLSGTFASQGYTGTRFNRAFPHRIGSHPTGAAYLNGFISNFYIIDGQALTPSSFGYTDPLTNTWRPKRYTGTYGTNGFYLPMDGNTPIGQDRSGNNNNWTPVNFGGSNTLEKATGALPILNTDGGGKVARVGVRTDSNASSLVLALPLVGISSDFSNRINSGTSNKTVTVTNAVASSAQSIFYGGSYYFDGTDDYITITNSSDFNYTTSQSFTVEMWLYGMNSGRNFPVGSTAYNSGTSNYNGGIRVDWTPGTNFVFQVGTGFVVGTNVTTNTWHHVAYVYDAVAQTSKLYVDGVQNGSTTSGTQSLTNAGNLLLGVQGSDLILDYQGYIQDFRIYKGLAKYTQNFIPASTDPDILPDTPSGVAYSSNVALVPSTDGAVAFDGSGDYLQTAASGTDFTVGGGAFSIECYAYFNSFSGSPIVFSAGTGGVSALVDSNGYLSLYRNGAGGYFSSLSTNQISTGRWYHLAWVTSNGSQWYGYVDGVQGTFAAGWSGEGTTSPGYVGTYGNGVGTQTPNAFISNLHIVKGTALYTSNFTPPTAPITSVANTKLLCCKSNTSATAFDVSPGTITANGDAKATNFNPFTVNINTQRGQESGYCTLNPLQSSATLSNGNLDASTTSLSWQPNVSTIYQSSGKWYAEFLITSIGGGGIHIGIVGPTYPTAAGNYIGNTSTSYAYRAADGNKYNNAAASSYGPTYTTGDVIGVAFDADAGTITFYKNGISLGVAYSGLTGEKAFAFSVGSTSATHSVASNFGQKPFKFPPPAGFQPLALANTPRPSIVRPDQYVGITTYLSNGSARSVSIGWKPDLVWIKQRDGASTAHTLHDTIRGVNKHLASSATDAEVDVSGFGGGVTAFNNNGFSVGTWGAVNENTRNYVAWCWKAGGNSNTYNINDVGYATASAAGLTAGTITPTGASVNTKSGFSIIRYTGTGATGGTVSHGLTNPPSFIIAKSASASRDWIVYHKSLTKDQYINLNLTTGASSTSNVWGSAEPTSSVFGVYAWSTAQNNANGENMIAYCWAEIPGFSKFGSYVGDGSTTGFGPYINCGFRPRYVIIKSTTVAYSWLILDSVRNPSNLTTQVIYADSSAAEMTNNGTGSGGYESIDIFSNGFQIKSNSSRYNQSGQTYIYCAFAETPSFNLYGGQANAR